MMLVVVFALAIAPLGSTLCAALCAPVGRAAQASDAQEPTTSCHGQSKGVRLGWSSTGHDCGNHDAISLEATVSLVAARPDYGLVPALHVADGLNRSLPALRLYRLWVSARPPIRAATTSDSLTALRI
jgi:hypothetical protein